MTSLNSDRVIAGKTSSRNGENDFIKLNSVFAFMLSIFLAGCEKDIDIDIKDNEPLLVVEGYINNLLPRNNYVVLSHSIDFYNPQFEGAAVSGAKVTITEGSLGTDNRYVWDQSTTVQLMEANNPLLPENFRQGVYFDPRLINDSANALKGQVGKHYLLEIETDGKSYSAITSLLTPVPIDSLTCGYSFVDTDDEDKEKARITIHYQDPDTLGNSQLFYWQNAGNRNNYGWGGIAASWRNYGVDDLTNGQYMRVTQNRGFEIGETVTYYMASVTRDVYDFWENFRDARNNEGPFTTPVSLLNKINGENVTGCFSGLSLSAKTVKVYK